MFSSSLVRSSVLIAAILGTATIVVAPQTPRIKPSISMSKVLDLAGATNENFATISQAMNVWESSTPQSELVVGLTHQYNNIDLRADDKQFIVAWSYDGTEMLEVFREKASCADVNVAVPSRGPYVYEFRLDETAWSLHPECSCVPSQGRACPAGVLATNSSGSSRNLTSPISSHFVHLENEWGEWILDNGILGRLRNHVEAVVKVVSSPLINASSSTQGIDPIYACPGTIDEPLGSQQVTKQQLLNIDRTLPAGHVTGGWCVVRRGWCSETAKMKVCENSGAVGTIIVDHGNFDGDQDITITYNRASNWEAALKPVLFLSKSEGDEIISWARSDSGVRIAVGPTVGGPPPLGYEPGSGITVHTIIPGSSSSASSKRSYPNIFDTSAWLEVSAIRDLLFVCQQQQAAVLIYNVSKPLDDIPYVGKFDVPCSRSGSHDYRILDYKGQDGRYYTLVVDPYDSGNRLYYYDTQDPTRPVLQLRIHADWEAENGGLGQVRPGGPGGRYHIVTWHCANLYCGKNHGDALYVLSTANLSRSVSKIPIPQMGVGGFARDIACGMDALCLLSLTWDGLVAVDTGVSGTVNPLSVVAANEAYFSRSSIPQSVARLRMHSGAQKVYASKAFSRRFYVEHSDFSLRPLRLGDSIRALQLTELWMAEVIDYDASVRLPNTMVMPPIYGNASLGCEWKLAPMCVQEFEYRGKTHKGCLTQGDGETGWCSHDPIFAGSWSSCISGCVLDCAHTGETLPGGPGAEFIVICPPGCGNSIIWGDQLYSDDSSLCAAAIHAGVTTRSGGRVMITLYAGQASYPSVTANGVTSFAWGKWGRSFMVGPPGGRTPPQPTPNRADACKACTWDIVKPCVVSFAYSGTTHHGCTVAGFGDQGWCSHDEVYRGRWSECTSSCGRTCSQTAQTLRGETGSTHLFICPQGCGTHTAWGTDEYGDDSAVCTAAIHAGAIDASGGCVLITIAEGRDRYTSSLRNGVKTFSWGSWERSFTVSKPDEDSRTNVIGDDPEAASVGLTVSYDDDGDEVGVGIIAALVAVSIFAICLGCWTIYLMKAYKRSQNLVQQLQSIPAAGAGDAVVVGSPVCPDNDDENPLGAVIGEPLGMPPTVVTTDAWNQKDSQRKRDSINSSTTFLS